MKVRKIPHSRRFVVDALKVGRAQIPVHGLLDVDITTARRHLEAHDPPLSTTAFVAACVGQAAARHPEVHAYRNWRGRLVLQSHVDIATLIEVPTSSGSFPLAHLIHNADGRSVPDISAEIRSIQQDSGASQGGLALDKGLPRIASVPGLVRLGYHLANRSVALRRRTGTVALTAVGMFGGGSGFAIAAPTIASLGVVVGGISEQPRVVAHELVTRQIMNLTITVDHRIVDGAPAARFAADLRRLIESAELLSTQN